MPTESERLLVAPQPDDVAMFWPPAGYVVWLDDAGISRVIAGGAVVRRLSLDEKVVGPPRRGATLIATVREVDVESARRALGSLGVTVLGQYPSPDGLVNVIVNGPVRAIAGISAVLFVAQAPHRLAPLDEMSNRVLTADGSRGAVTPGYGEWLHAAGVDGRGVRVAIVDSGIDAHPDLADRIVGKDDMSMLPTGEPIDLLGHGTHVAGIVAGDAAPVPGLGRAARDTEGFLYGLGVAPGAELVDVSAVSLTADTLDCDVRGGWSPAEGWQRLTQGALRFGASLWNASWKTCEGPGVGYVDSSRAMDALVRDGDPMKEGEQPFTMVFAAGNAGPRGATIEAPSEAKNTIVVGATINPRSFVGDRSTVADFSSRGPARDGRIFPTVVAPGEFIVSARSTVGVQCNVPLPDGYGRYTQCSGTSMAAPHATGAVALLTQWWRQRTGSEPSPALAKALLVNTATDIGEPDVPNPSEGWGRVNVAELLTANRELIHHDQRRVLDDVGDVHDVRVDVADPSAPVKMSLVWTDAPGAVGASKALVNDLDLEVTAPDGTVYRGNNFHSGASTAGGAPDRLNNVENVFLPAGAGTYRVRVSATALPGDGVPGSADATDQDFALVVTHGGQP